MSNLIKQVYLDFAAATPVLNEVIKEMNSYSSEKYANPNSTHLLGKIIRKDIEKSRERIARIIQSRTDEILFTSGGTESVNLALQGFALEKKKGHIITSSIEHSCVIETCKFLEKKGFSVTYLPVTSNGIVELSEVKKAIRKDTILISIMYANNELGTIQPIREIASFARSKGIIFHTDACQAAVFLNMNVNNLGVDMMSFCGSKTYGPKGAGLLFKKKDIKIKPISYGGEQEFGLRSGTENVSAIIGFAKAFEITKKTQELEKNRISKLRNYFVNKSINDISDCSLQGNVDHCLPNFAHLAFKDVIGENLNILLSERGVFASNGSACVSSKNKGSHVLKAIGFNQNKWGSIRFSLGRTTNKKDLDYALEVLKESVKKLRSFNSL